MLYDEHPYPIDFVTKFQLMPIINGLAEDDEMVLVKEVASQLARSFAEDAALLERQAALKKDTTTILEGAIKKYSKSTFFQGTKFKKDGFVSKLGIQELLWSILKQIKHQS